MYLRSPPRPVVVQPLAECNNCGSVTRVNTDLIAPKYALPLAPRTLTVPLPSAIHDRQTIQYYCSEIQNDIQETARDNEWLRSEVAEVLRQNEQLRSQLKGGVEGRERERLRLADISRRRAEEERLRIETILRSEEDERRRNAAKLDEARRYELANRQADLNRYNTPYQSGWDNAPRAAPAGSGSGYLRLKIIQGSQLMVADFKTSDPFVEIWYDQTTNSMAKTNTVDSNLNPVWNAEFIVEIPRNHPSLILKVFDQDTFNKNDSMGQATLDLLNLRGGTQVLPLTPGNDSSLAKKSLGSITISTEYLSSAPPGAKIIHAPPRLLH